MTLTNDTIIGGSGRKIPPDSFFEGEFMEAEKLREYLTKIYRDFWGRQKVRALNALDLEIRKGEIFGLLGIFRAHLVS